MKKEENKLTIVLISIIVVLVLILGYGFYTGIKVQEEIRNLNSQITNLVSEKNNLTSQLDDLQSRYNLLKDDVFELEKSCITENACKGRFPGVRWYCNNVGDEVSDYSHICVCDSSCVFNIITI